MAPNGQLFSHKLLRYLAPLFQIIAFVAGMALGIHGGLFWRWALLAQIVFYATACVGYLRRRASSPRPVTLAYYLCLVNAAAAVALWRFARGEHQVTWTPRT